jgi:hypothetical protein
LPKKIDDVTTYVDYRAEYQLTAVYVYDIDDTVNANADGWDTLEQNLRHSVCADAAARDRIDNLQIKSRFIYRQKNAEALNFVISSCNP